MINAEIITLITTSVAIIGFVYGFLRNFKADVNKHMDAIGLKLDEHIKETKIENAKMDQRVMETNKRMDGVYHLLIKRSEKFEV